MDLRDIQNLHAHYASQPVMIDIAGQVAAAQAIPALPSPDPSDSHARRSGRLVSATRRHAKPLALAAFLVVVAGAAGMGAARLWAIRHPMPQHAVAARTAVSAPPSAAVSQPDQVPASGPATVPPLTSADFGASVSSARPVTVNTGEVLGHAPPRKCTDRPERTGSRADRRCRSRARVTHSRATRRGRRGTGRDFASGERRTDANR
jgi:hypothetical protein